MYMNLFTAIMYDYLKSDDHARHLASEATNTTNTTQEAVDKLEVMLEKEYLQAAPVLNGVYQEVFSAGMENIDFYQIAKRFLNYV